MKLLITGAFDIDQITKDQIELMGFEIIFLEDETKRTAVDVSEIEGIICNSFFVNNDIEKFHKLKFIQLTSSGIDRIPLDYIIKKNIKYYTAKDTYSIPMSEWVIQKILEIYNNSKQAIQNQQRKIWIKNRNALELYEKKVSIIGYGAVGKEIAKRLRGFSTYTIAVGNKLNLRDRYIDHYYNISELNIVLKQSDVVIITLPLNDSTELLFDYKLLSLMKDTAILLNLSRGKIINEYDLVKILKEEKILGCALDVFSKEPLSQESELWDLPNVYITPHESFISTKNHLRLKNIIINNLKKELVRYNVSNK